MTGERRPVDVLLVSPPVASVVRPNMGLSALKAALGRRGIASAIWYLNMDFADRVGVAANEWLAISSPMSLLLGEWAFSALIRDGGDPTADLGYAREIEGRLPADAACDAHALARIRLATAAFIEDAARRVAELRPRILGVSTTFQQTCAGLALARLVKQRAPETLVCFGGANCDHPMGAALADAFPQIDHVFSGEADAAFPDLAEEVLRGGARPRPARPRALPVAGQDGQAARVIRGRPIAPLDELPFPDMDDYFEELERQSFRPRVQPALVFESSRGCWWGAKHHCTFCGLNGDEIAFRSKSPERVVRELAWLARRHGVSRFEAVDNILDPRHVEGVFDRLAAAGAELSLRYEVKSNMSHEQLARAARGGLTHVRPGIESLDDYLLELMGKGVTALQNIAFLRSCREIGVVPCWNMLYRFPGERPDCYDDMLALLPRLEHLDPPISASGVRLDRYSPYFERAAANGYTGVAPLPAYARVFGVAPEVAAQIAYFFVGDNTRVLPREAMAPFLAGLERWRARHRDPAAAPVLHLIESEGQAIVVDTRACAAEPMAVLDEGELRMLKAFRKPASIAGVAGEAALAHLLERGYLVQIGGKVVSVVCEAGWRVHAEGEPFPGGGLRGGRALVASPPLVADPPAPAEEGAARPC